MGEFRSGAWQPEKLSDVAAHVRGCLRPRMRQAERAIDWMRDNTAMIVRKIRAADSAPGVRGSLLGKPCYFYGAHEEERFQGLPGRRFLPGATARSASAPSMAPSGSRI